MADVAVIGAGAAGLAAAVELQRSGLDVVVFERTAEVGGVWVYDDAPGRTMYASLRTNLPRDLMAFRSYPFDSSGGGDDAWPRFPSHECVLEYLRGYADHNGIASITEFETEVTGLTQKGDSWTVTTRRRGVAQSREYSSVVVCNGHFSVPRQLVLEGSDSFPGIWTHSRDYRRPDRFTGMRVAVVGTGSSGFDLAVEISTVADEVYWCGRDFTSIQPYDGVRGVFTAPLPDSVDGDRLSMAGSSRAVDAVICCTGFHYDLQFVDPAVVTGVDAPTPLYRHLIPVDHPTMALIGIPQRIIPFPLFEMQAAWFGAVLTGRVVLPSRRERQAWFDDWQRQCRAGGREPYQARNLGAEQFDYIDDLARECGSDPLPGWYRPLAQATQDSRLAHPLDFREQPIAVRGQSVVPNDS